MRAQGVEQLLGGAFAWWLAALPAGVMTRMRQLQAIAICAILVALSVVTGCDTINTYVVLDNEYPPSVTRQLVIYRAFWQAIAFQTPVLPGASSDPQSTVAASANTAWVLLAPGWDPTSAVPPTSFIVLESPGGFAVHLDDTLHIPVDDTTFQGNCAAGSFLTKDQADFITQRVFASAFAGSRYDAATCTTTSDSR